MDDSELYKPMDVLVGEVLASRYRIESRLGKGATGVVYRARHVKVGRPFAVKVLHSEHAEDATLLRRFEREAELAGRVRHPNVISVVDVGERPDGTRYMVMELAQGIDLATLLHNEAPLPAARVINLVRQLLDGLYHAHERGVIHRDLKPENIIVERDDDGAEVPRIVDFGIAIARVEAETPDGPERLTTGGIVLGTPHYMAPEQATGSSMDHRIDLFALGIILYEMLCGEMPFDGNGVEVARANLLNHTPAMGVRVPHLEVDPLLEAFTRVLLSKDPAERPMNAKAARELLDLIDRDRTEAARHFGMTPQQTLTLKETMLGVPPATSTSKRAPTVPENSSRRTPLPGVPTPVSVEMSQRMELSAPSSMTWSEASAPAVPVTPAESSSSEQLMRIPRSSEPPPITEGQRVHQTDELQIQPAGNRWNRIASIAAVAAVIIFAGVFALSENGKADEPKHDKIAAVEPTPTPTPPAPTPPTPAPTPPAPTPNVNPTPTPPTPTPPPPTPPTPTPNNIHKPTPVPTPTPTPPPPTPANPPPPTPTPTPATLDTSTAAVASLYGTVGRELKHLAETKGNAAADDLWLRYRRIQINTALRSDDTRAAVSRDLEQIRRDISRASR